MENVVMITFDVEAQAYQAFSQLKNDSVNSAYTILQMAVIKNGDGKIVPVDGFDSGIDSTDDTWTGGLIGSVVGILGGPLGVLLGASIGLLTGSIMDANDADDNSSLILYGSQALGEGKTAIVALVQESDEKAFDLRLADYRCTITRWDAGEIADEVGASRRAAEAAGQGSPRKAARPEEGRSREGASRKARRHPPKVRGLQSAAVTRDSHRAASAALPCPSIACARARSSVRYPSSRLAPAI